MTAIVEEVTPLSDAEYIRHIANSYRFSEVREFKQHCARLDAIAERLESLDKRIVTAVNK